MYPFLAAFLTASDSCFKAGSFLRKDVFNFLPSLAPLPTIVPILASPAPYKKP